jgi:succinate-semialdehyde dehydrogenase/glutarate-semialdehyde dehydrogenase
MSTTTAAGGGARGAGGGASYEWANPSLSPASLAKFYNEQLWPSTTTTAENETSSETSPESSSPGFFSVLDPAKGEPLCSLRLLGGAETKEAVNRAHAAFATGGWSQQQATAQKRYDALVKWERLVRLNARDLAALVTLENGKPLSEALGEVTGGADSLAWFAEEARRVDGDLIPGAKRGQKILVMKQPVGVVGAITPWNFPFSMITRKIGPALAAGCTVVLKPSEDTPLSAIALVQLARQCGFPSGCIQLVCGDAPAIGKEMVEAKQVRKIGFSGSTQVGKLLYAQSAQALNE